MQFQWHDGQSYPTAVVDAKFGSAAHTPRPHAWFTAPPTPPTHIFHHVYCPLLSLVSVVWWWTIWLDHFFRPDGGCMKRVFAICLLSGLILVKTWAWDDGCSSADVPPVYDKRPVNKVKAKTSEKEGEGVRCKELIMKQVICGCHFWGSHIKLEPSPHRVTLWGSAGYFERLVALCCWHICVTPVEAWENT